jgi:hypothetical protein
MQTINTGQGLGKIKFGMTPEELKALLGQPDEIEKFAPDTIDDLPTENWHYDEKEMSVSFVDDQGWKIESIAVSTQDYDIQNKKLIGLSLDKVVVELEQLELGNILHEDLSDEEDTDYQLLSIGEKSIYFWFEDEVLKEISWGPYYDEENNPIWP